MKIVVFFSWQSTTDRKYNKNFILNCIEKAVKNIQKYPDFKGVDMVVDEGMRGEPGSPQVASTIIEEKIPNCDVFIADLSVVNQQNRFAKWLLRIFGNEYKPFQNNNVIKEYGVAVNQFGYKHIIGVMNATYGSPNENPENIPFDIRHVRFPIEYSYSNSTKERQTVQQNLIKNLEIAIKETAIFALQKKKNKYRPFILWEDWDKEMKFDYDFFTNDKINQIKKLVLSNIDEPNQTTRILGLSGLGKTRMIFEIFKPLPFTEEKVILASRVLYVDCNKIPQFDFYSLFTTIQRDNENRIVILDNCKVETHRLIKDFAKKGSNRLSFITIDSNPEEIESDNKINEINYILIKKEELKSVVEQILNVKFGQLEKEQIEKIREFSQGIPLMAVLLGNSVKDREDFIGNLDDKTLLNKLLGEKGKEEKARKILRSCSLFSYFGYYEDLERQTEFIATNKFITPIDGSNDVLIDDFKTVCNYYIKREILEKRGRYISMRPLPLAIYLAQEWFETSNEKRLLDLIRSIDQLESIDKRVLSEALAEQMKFLGDNDKAILIIENIVGPQSPFDNAEVLNTELGSRLFRSFVEVNPVAVLQNFIRNFSSKSKEELLKIDQGRRNLVWVLEKLCFDKRTFSEGVKILCSFAIAENEKWANNASSQFLHLFNIYLPGTEVNLEERLKIIDWAITSKQIEYQKIGFDAMRVGLNYGHFTRTSGAEKQGSRRLHDYDPPTHEIINYWENIISRLIKIVKENGIHADIASDIIAGCFRSLCYAGVSGIAISAIKEIAELKGYSWDKALNNIKDTYKYHKKQLREHEVKEIEELIDSLKKDDFKSRLMVIINSYHLEGDGTYSYDKVVEETRKLADEFCKDDYDWDEYLILFYSNSFVNSFPFGKRLYEIHKQNPIKVQEFISKSIKVLLNIQNDIRNVTLLGGYVYESSKEIKDEFYSTINKNDELRCLLFYFISLDSNGKNYLELLLEIIDSERCSINSFHIFKNSIALRNFESVDLIDFRDKLIKYKQEGFVLIFNIFSNLQNVEPDVKDTIKEILKDCVLNIDLRESGWLDIDSYRWKEIICLLLDNTHDTQFAVSVNKQIINSFSLEAIYHFEYGVQHVYEILLKQYFSDIWDDLSIALLSIDEEYIKYYNLKQIFGSHIGGARRNVGVLFEGDIDKIFEWCQSNKPEAPARLASLAPIFDGNNDVLGEWHPIAIRLINEFGDNEEMLVNLGANMGSFSWVGSIVPLLKGKLKLFSFIKDHKIETVASWAKRSIPPVEEQINYEKNKDEEYYLR